MLGRQTSAIIVRHIITWLTFIYNGGDLTKAKSWFQSGAFLPRGDIYDMGGDPKEAKFHYEATAMAGDENARYNLGGTVRKHGTSC
jgi:TPR repeat protein